MVLRSRWRSTILGRRAESALRSFKKLNALNTVLSTTTLIDFAVISMPVFPYIDATFQLAIGSDSDFWRSIHPASVERLDGLERDQLLRAKGILVFSSWVKESCTMHYGVPPERIEVVGYGANLPDVPDFSKKDVEKPYILFVCTDFAAKGGETIVKAFEIVQRWNPDVQLVIVGNVPKGIAAQMKAGVRLVGYRDKSEPAQLAELLEIYKGASVLVLGSAFDPMPNVLFEAMYLKTPVVATKVCGIPEQVEEGRTGFLIPPLDAKSLADRLVALLGNNELRWDMGVRGRERVEKLFTWDGVVDRSIRFISRSLG